MRVQGSGRGVYQRALGVGAAGTHPASVGGLRPPYTPVVGCSPLPVVCDHAQLGSAAAFAAEEVAGACRAVAEPLTSRACEWR